MKLATATAALAALLPTLAGASDVSYDYVQLEYAATSPDEGPDSDGFAAAFSHLFNDRAFVVAGYDQQETDELPAPATGSLKASLLRLGLGLRGPMSGMADMFGVASVIRGDASGTGSLSGIDESDTGFGVEVGIRALVAEPVETLVSVNYEDLFDDDVTFLKLGITGDIGLVFALTGSVTVSNDGTGYQAGIRYNF